MVAELEDHQFNGGKLKLGSVVSVKLSCQFKKKHNYYLNNCIIVGGGRCTADITSNFQLEWTQIKKHNEIRKHLAGSDLLMNG